MGNARRYSHRLCYHFNMNEGRGVEPFRVSTDIRFAKNQQPEHVEICGNTVTLSYTRSKKENLETALSNPRHLHVLDRVQCCYVLAGYGVPTVSGVELHVEGSSATSESRSDLLPKMFVGETQSVPKLSPGESPLLSEDYIRILRISSDNPVGRVCTTIASYFIASCSATNEVDRFRLLWSGFNAAYAPLSGKKREDDCLSDLAERILSGGADSSSFKLCLNKYRETITDDKIRSLGWYQFARDQLYKGGKERRDRDEIRSRKLACCSKRMFRSLRAVAKSLDKQRGEKKPDLADYLETVQCRSDIDSDLLLMERKELVFLLTQYLYSYRCSSMHGSRQFSLYVNPTSEKSLSWLNEVLECALVDCIVEVIRR